MQPAFQSSNLNTYQDTSARASSFHGRDSQKAGGGAGTNDVEYDALSRRERHYVPDKYGPGAGRRLDENRTVPDGERGGRRLWTQDWFVREPRLDRNLVTHRIMDNGPLTGITLSECSAICEALRRNSSDSAGTEECQAFAYQSANPASLTDFTLSSCYFLRVRLLLIQTNTVSNAKVLLCSGHWKLLAHRLRCSHLGTQASGTNIQTCHFTAIGSTSTQIQLSSTELLDHLCFSPGTTTTTTATTQCPPTRTRSAWR